jgi:hypothetical protein
MALVVHSALSSCSSHVQPDIVMLTHPCCSSTHAPMQVRYMERDGAELQAAGAGAQHRDVMQDIFLQVSRSWLIRAVSRPWHPLISKPHHQLSQL